MLLYWHFYLSKESWYFFHHWCGYTHTHTHPHTHTHTHTHAHTLLHSESSESTQCKLFLSVPKVNIAVIINILFSYLFCHLLDFFSISAFFWLKMDLHSAALKGWISPLTSPSISHPLVRSYSSLFLMFFSQLISYLGIPLSPSIFIYVSDGPSVLAVDFTGFSIKMEI